MLGERVALRLDHLLGQDRGSEHRERGEERRRRLGQRDHHGALVRRVDRLDDLVRVGPGRLRIVAQAGQAEGDVGRRHRAAVRELGRAQMEGVGQPVVRDLPVLGEIGDDPGRVGIRAHQERVHVVEHPDVGVGGAPDRIEGRDADVGADAQHALRARLAAGQRERRSEQRPARDAPGGCDRSHLSLPLVFPDLSFSAPAYRPAPRAASKPK